MSINEILSHEVQMYYTLCKLVEHLGIRFNQDQNSKFIADMGLPAFRRKSDGNRDVLEYFDDLVTALEESFYIRLVAQFEEYVFKRLENALGELRSIAKEEYPKAHNVFSQAISQLVKNVDDIGNLRGVEILLESYSVEDLLKTMKAIRKHRNWLAHGKGARFGSNSGLNLEEVEEHLKSVYDLVNEA